MNYLTVFILAIIATVVTAQQLKLSEEQIARLTQSIAECSTKEGVSHDDVKELRSGNFDKADDKIKCFVNCFLENLGLIEKGVVKADVILAKLGPLLGEDVVKNISAKCDHLTGANDCETALNIYKCYYENKAEL